MGRRALLLMLLVMAVAPASARALTVGLADQRASSFADPRLRALDLKVARLVVPWDAATSEPGEVQAWLAAAAAAGMTPAVAFEHLTSERCPASPCSAPSRAAYGAAVRRFVALFPQVRTYTTWNEANHSTQPVWSRPEAVAGYYEELRSACSGCTIVAGDVLDDGSYVSWLRRFAAATSTAPRLWGLHNYGDTTYGTTTGTDAVLNAVSGQLWLEETGGIVAIRNAAGRTTLGADETRAAAGIDRAFSIALARPRIARLYVYQWQALPGDRFDAGLVRPDGALRPSYAALVRDLAALPATGAPAATVAAPRWVVAWSKVKPKQLLVRVTCAAGSACTGRVTVTLRTRAKGRKARFTRLVVRSYRTTTRTRSLTLRVTASRAVRRWARAAATRRVVLRVAATKPATATTTKRLVLGKPR